MFLNHGHVFKQHNKEILFGFWIVLQCIMTKSVLITVTQTINIYVNRMLSQTKDIGMDAKSDFFQSIMSFVVVLLATGLLRESTQKTVFEGS